jgi:dienelactone hydrolase
VTPRAVVAVATAAAAFAMMTVGAHADARREVLTIDSGSRTKPAKIRAELFLPDVAAGKKVPAMLIVHGSAEPRERREGAYAKEFLKLGVAAVIVDSFSLRGIKSTVRHQSQVSSTDMLVDALNAMRAVAARPEIDASRVGLIGFSKGGSVAAKAALQRYKKFVGLDTRDFSLLIAMYPWCGDMPFDFTPAGAQLFLMLGEADTYAGVAPCKEFGERLKKKGGDVTVKVFAGAKHDWDTPGRESWSDSKGENFSQCIYDETEPGTWIERKSRIKIEDNGKPTGKSKEAQARCVTIGVSGGYNAKAHADSTALIRQIVRQKFDLR